MNARKAHTDVYSCISESTQTLSSFCNVLSGNAFVQLFYQSQFVLETFDIISYRKLSQFQYVIYVF